jgi:hypothetical protein
MTDFNQNNLPFRPLDNSMSTQMRYDLEAEKWSSAMKSAQIKATSSAGTLGLIGAIIGFAVSLIIFVIVLLIELTRLIARLLDRKSVKQYKSNSQKVTATYDVPDSEFEKPW